MKWLIYTICVCIYTFAYGQSKVESYLETWIVKEGTIGESLDFDEVYQAYLAIHFTVNDFYVDEKWDQFFFLNSHELQRIKSYLQNSKNETSIAFLNSIKELSREKSFLIRYKVLDNQKLKQTKRHKQSVTTYITIPNSKLLESFKNRNRIHLSQSGFQMVLQTEKDLNELSVIDFVSGGFKLSGKNMNWYFGDYTAQFGLGTSLYQGYQTNTLSQINTMLSNGFKIHSGTEENRYLRGVATEYLLNNNNKISGFISYNQVDGIYNQNGIVTLYSDGNHVSNTDVRNKNSISLLQSGVTYLMSKKQLKINTLAYISHFNSPRVLNNTQIKNQVSYSNTIAYYNSRIHIVSEFHVDQFKYWSKVINSRWYLGNAFYIKSYYGIENKDFNNPFRKIPKSYTQPEKFFGYRLEFLGKYLQVKYAYHNAKNRIMIFNHINFYRLNADYKLKNRSVIQLRMSYREKDINNGLQIENTHILRTRISYQIQERGLWSWKQNIYLKTGSSLESGFAYSMQFNFKNPTCNIGLGGVFYSQNQGAFYIYESDVLSSGYTRGVFNSGTLYYVIIQKHLGRLSLQGKLRVSQQKSQTEYGCSFGVKYKL